MRRIKEAPGIILIFSLLFSVFSTISAQDWPWFRGANHDGISAEKLSWPANGPKQVWKTNVGVGHSAVSVVNGLVYSMGNRNDTDLVVCLDMNP